MTAGTSQKVQALILACLALCKITAYTVAIVVVIGNVLMTGHLNYYLLSALLWMRSSINEQVEKDWQNLHSAVTSLILERVVLVDKTQSFRSLGVLCLVGGLCYIVTLVFTLLQDRCCPPCLRSCGYTVLMTGIGLFSDSLF